MINDINNFILNNINTTNLLQLKKLYTKYY